MQGSFLGCFQERRGVPARWGDPARGIPTAKVLTVREGHEPGPPLEPGPLAPCPLRRGAEFPAGRGGPGSKGGRGPGSWYSSAYTVSSSVGIPRAGSPQRAGTPRIFPCFRQGMVGMSRDLGRDAPGSEKENSKKTLGWFFVPYP